MYQDYGLPKSVVRHCRISAPALAAFGITTSENIIGIGGGCRLGQSADVTVNFKAAISRLFCTAERIFGIRIGQRTQVSSGLWTGAVKEETIGNKLRVRIATPSARRG